MTTFTSRFAAFALLAGLATTTLATVAGAQPIAGPEAGPTEPTPAGADLVGPEQPPLLSIGLNKSSAVYQAGDLLRVKLKVEQTSYVYVFYHQADKQAVLLFPNNSRRHNLLGSRTTITAPAENDTLQCRIGAPFGREAVQVITSPTRITDFERALSSAGQGVPVMPTRVVDQVCQKHAEKASLIADFVTLTTQERAAE
ncbi:MAG: DUF4384 domain-containing protein [Planctomycetota bacterium]